MTSIFYSVVALCDARDRNVHEATKVANSGGVAETIAIAVALRCLYVFLNCIFNTR